MSLILNPARVRIKVSKSTLAAKYKSNFVITELLTIMAACARTSISNSQYFKKKLLCKTRNIVTNT